MDDTSIEFGRSGWIDELRPSKCALLEERREGATNKHGNRPATVTLHGLSTAGPHGRNKNALIGPFRRPIEQLRWLI